MKTRDIQYLKHGIKLYSGGGVEQSKRFGCYLDAEGNLRFGYIYKNGSNYRVVRWKDGKRKNGTVSREAPIILFLEVKTSYSFKSTNFREKDFNFSWLDTDAKKALEKALKGEDVADKMAGLSLK